MNRVLIISLAILAATVATAQEFEESTTRYQDDLRALETYRPGYAFWQHIFTIPDGRIAFGSARDGRLLAVFPRRGDWHREAVWHEPSLASILDGVRLPANVDERRDRVAELLQAEVGPVVHNPTRGGFLTPSARRYGSFLQEWSAIYARFGVPAEVGLAQAAIESGLSGTRRSEARAIGFCQFLDRNWRQMSRIAPYPIESRNQTTQAAYCAAYLSILATKYGSFIPALSDHHSGGVNVGRVLINGERLDGDDVRDRYFLGSQLARDLRQIDLYGYRDIYRTYGPRSHVYSEMVFGNIFNIRNILASTKQETIYAMRTPRALRLADITRRTRLSADAVRRYNPALVRQVPARATVYLPMYVKEFGPDVSFWHRPASEAYLSVLEDFLEIDESPERWDERSFEPTLRRFVNRFRETKTEEGTIMATALRYVMEETYSSTRAAILADFRESDEVQRLFERAVRDRNARRGERVGCPDAAVLQAGLPAPC